MALTVSATDTEVQKPVNVIYEEQLLRQARPLAPYFAGTTSGDIERNGGSATIKWRRFNTSADNASGISPSTTALSELTGNASYMQGRSSDTVHFSDVTATVSKYGQFFILNEEVDTFNPNGTMAGIVSSLAISAGRSLNRLQRNIAEDNATLIYAGNVASDGAVQSVATTNSFARTLNTLSNNSAMPFSPMTDGSTNIGTNPTLPAYWSICHPDVAYDIAQFTGFKSVETYAGQVDVMPGEFGSYGVAGFTVRCIQTPEASKDEAAGGSVTSFDLNGTSGIDLYTTIIYGQDAVGSVGLGEQYGDGIYRGSTDASPLELIVKGLGSGGSSDPFDEIMTVAWKAWHTGAILNANWIRGIRSGATNLTN